MKFLFILLLFTISLNLSAQQLSYKISYNYNNQFQHDDLNTNDFKTARDIFCIRCESEYYEFVEEEITAKKKACLEKYGNDGIHCNPFILEKARPTLLLSDENFGGSSPKEGIHDCLKNSDGSFSLYKIIKVKQKVKCPPNI